MKLIGQCDKKLTFTRRLKQSPTNLDVQRLKKSLDILKTANTISPTHSEVEIELILDEDTELNNEVLDTTNEVAEEAAHATVEVEEQYDEIMPYCPPTHK